jgi:hypothetical protein
MTSLLLGALLPTLAAADPPSRPAFVFEGERWRLELPREAGTFDFRVQPQGETEFVSVLRPGGEAPWYGYNVSGGPERRTCEVTPDFRPRSPRFRCVLEPGPQVVHEAAYHPFANGVLVVSRFVSEGVPPVASIVRFAPKLDVDVDLLTRYAFADDAGSRHEGGVAELGARAAYAGVGGWGGPGDVVGGLDPARPYMLLYNPDRAVSLGIVLLRYPSLWAGAQTFLQLYHGGWNFWYTGFLPRSALRGERVFVLYARQVATPDTLEADLPALVSEAERLIAEGEVEAPEVRAAMAAETRFAAEWEAANAAIRDQPPTREAWLAADMLRAARACLARDPVKAVDLLDRARAALPSE